MGSGQVCLPVAKRASICIAALVLSAIAAQAQIVFSSPENVSNTAGNSISQQIVVDSHGDVNVVWTDNTSGGYAVLFSRSSDGGSTFSSPANVSSGASGTAQTPQMAVDSSGNIYIVWENFVSGTSSAIEFSHSSNGGASFSSPSQISQGTTASGPRVAADSLGAIDFAWSDNSTGVSQIFFSRSTNQGTSFSAPQNVSGSAAASTSAALGLDSSGNIYVAWSEAGTIDGLSTANVFFSDVSEAATAFSAPTQVSNNGPQVTIGGPNVAASSMTNIYVASSVEITDGSWQVVSAYSADSGATFTSQQASVSNEYPLSQQLALDPTGSANIVWQSSQGSGSANVTFARSTAGGPFTTSAVANPGGNTPNPQLAIDSSGNINVVFYGTPAPQTGSSGILYSRSTNLGATFSAAQNVSTDFGSLPQISLDAGGSPYVAWQAGSDNADIFFSRGTSTALSSVTVSPSTVTGGGSSSGAVTLSEPAPAGGAVVTLSSSNSAASVPASVTVPAGQTSETFGITTTAVTTATPVTISGTYNGVTQSGTLTVEPPATPQISLVLNPSTIRGLGFSQATVTLKSPAPKGGAVVTITSSNPREVIEQSQVTIPAGRTSAQFTILALPSTGATTVTITVSYSGSSASAALTINPLRPFVTVMQRSPVFR